MDNIGQSICEKQNLEINIQRLAAQNQFYYLGKSYFTLQFCLNVVGTALLLIVGLIINHLYQFKIDWFRSFYAFTIVLLDYLVISNEINKCKTKAATIQETFDCEVLNIEWNKVLVGEKPLPEDVQRYSKKYLKRVRNFIKVTDWYDITIKELSNNAAKIVCQRSNLTYDYAIRERFKNWVVGIAIGILILALAMFAAKNFLIQDCLVNLIIPYIPILTFTLKIYIENKTSLKNLDSLKSNINNSWATLLIGGVISEQTIRQMQDKMYLNRKSNPLIPEWIYNRLRPGLEEAMYYSVKHLVEEYKQNLEAPKAII